MPEPTREPAAPRGGGSASAEATERDARRFETYFRVSLYLFTGVELLYLVGTTVGAAGGVPSVVWVALVAGLAHVVLSVLVARWAFDHMRRPGPLPRRLLGGWLVAGVVTLVAEGLLGMAPAALGFTILVVVLVSVTMLTPLLTWRWACWATVWFIAYCVVFGALLPGPRAERVMLMVSGAFLAAMVLLTGWSFTWVIRVLHQLRDAQAAQARLAVADERLRISRDLHDVFGRTLATIAVKSELAAQLVRRGRADDAYAELAEVRAIADTAGKEVRHVVRGDSAVALAQELEGARSLLASAGIATTVVGDPDDVPAQAGTVLGWVVREAVTNVLRHSAASQASVSVAVDGDEATLLVANDGADLTGTSGSRTGIPTMRERLAPFAGDVEVTHDGGWFTLVATTRTPTPDRPSERSAP